jgi:hypothetical protein
MSGWLLKLEGERLPDSQATSPASVLDESEKRLYQHWLKDSAAYACDVAAYQSLAKEKIEDNEKIEDVVDAGSRDAGKRFPGLFPYLVGRGAVIGAQTIACYHSLCGRARYLVFPEA